MVDGSAPSKIPFSATAALFGVETGLELPLLLLGDLPSLCLRGDLTFSLLCLSLSLSLLWLLGEVSFSSLRSGGAKCLLAEPAVILRLPLAAELVGLDRFASTFTMGWKSSLLTPDPAWSVKKGSSSSSWYIWREREINYPFKNIF